MPAASLSPAIAGSTPQHLLALERANVIRLARADVKRRLRAGALTLEAALLDENCATARVSDLLLALPRMGPVKVGKLLAELRVSPNKLAGGLTARQRAELIGLVAGDRLPLEQGFAGDAQAEGLFA